MAPSPPTLPATSPGDGASKLQKRSPVGDMSKRTIQVFAVFNVVAACVLFVWFKTIPHQSRLSEFTEQVVADSTEVDAEVRLQLASSFRDAWEYRARQYSYWAILAGAVIAANAGVFFLHLAQATPEKTQSPKRGLQLAQLRRATEGGPGDGRDGE